MLKPVKAVKNPNKLHRNLAIMAALWLLTACGSDNPGAAGPADTTPPTTPTGLSGVALTAYQAKLTWSASTDDIGVTGYRILRDGVLVGTTSTTTYLNGGLSHASSYTYSVAAQDAQGNISQPTTALSVTTPTQGAATVLSTLAADMKPGTWAKLETEGFNNGDILLTLDKGSITEFTNEAIWDPIGRRIFVIGTARGNSAKYGRDINQKWIQYSDNSNAWEELPLPEFYLGFHSYDHAALDTVTGDYFVRIVDISEVWHYRVADFTWSRLPNMRLDYEPCCGALEYFPEMEALVFVRGSGDTNGNSEIIRYSTAANNTNSWEKITPAIKTPMGGFHNFTEYSAGHQVLFFGGGEIYQVGQQQQLYQMDKDGQVIRLTDAPITYGVQTAQTVVDPASGNLLLFPKSEPTSFYEHVKISNQWQKHTITPYDTAGNLFSTRSGNDQVTVATGIPDYGVILFIKHGNSDPGVYLYKHAP